MTVTCATDGNHGRSVAWGAQLFGCRCVIYIHATVSEGRRAAIAIYGAEVIRVEGNYDDSVHHAAKEAAKNGWTVVSDTTYEAIAISRLMSCTATASCRERLCMHCKIILPRMYSSRQV